MPRASLVPGGPAVTDLGGLCIVPGLIDSHVHITLPADGCSYEQVHRDPDELLALTAARNLRTHLAAGFTTMPDNGGRGEVVFAVREAMRRGLLAGPSLLAAGRPLTPTMGHFHFCGSVADGPVAIRAEVRRLVARGVDHIKVMASGGGSEGSRPSALTYTPEELRACVETAHDLGVPVAAHCRSLRSMHMAVAAGVDSIEHADFLEDEPPLCGLDTDPAEPAGRVCYDPRLVQDMADAGIYVGMILQAGGYERLLELAAPGRARGPGERREYERLRRYFDAEIDVLSRLLADGYSERLALSSDAGPGQTQFGRLDLWLDLASQAGMSRAAAIRACTTIAAKMCRAEKRIGVLEPGAFADFLVVGRGPYNQPDYGDVHAVYVGGILHHNASEVHTHNQPRAQAGRPHLTERAPSSARARQ